MLNVKKTGSYLFTPAQHQLRGLRLPSSPGSVPLRPAGRPGYRYRPHFSAGYAGLIDINREGCQELLVSHGCQLLSVLDMRE